MTQSETAPSGIYGAATDGRYLWVGGMAPDIPDAQLAERISAHQAREGSGSNFTMHKMDGGAWVYFTRPSLAQACLTALNGTVLTGAKGSSSTLRVRYATHLEDTTAPPAVAYLKRPLPTAAALAAVEEPPVKKPASAAPGARGDALLAAAGGQQQQQASLGISATSTTATAGKTDVNASKSKAESVAASTSANSVPAGAARPAASGSSSTTAKQAPHLPGGPGHHTDMLRAALSRLDVDVALTEIVHYLQSDERLPARTRKAVQFLDGLRQRMVHQQTHASHPELFDDPLGAVEAHATSVEGGSGSPTSVAYTFRGVRQSFGDDFNEQFWPVFRAFNCILPAHAPETASKGASEMLPP